MALTYDLTKDMRYQEGMEKGEKKGAELTEFSIREVQAMHRKMLKEDAGG